MSKTYILHKESKYVEFTKQPTGLVVIQCKVGGSTIDSFMARFKNSVTLYRALKKEGFQRIK